MTDAERRGTPPIALVLGITGGAGEAIARALQAHGWRIRALHRDPDQARAGLPWLTDAQWLQGDAGRAADVLGAATGTGVIVHAVNPPGYRNWRELALPMLENTIAAARASGARILFPGNIYNFGPDAWPVLREDSPQNPQTDKGAVRVEMESRLAAAANGGARTIVIRAGDFFGSRARGSWLAAAMVKPGRPVRSVTYPGARSVGHAWAYLPDFAETFAQVAAREASLPDFDRYHFGGHWVEPGIEMADSIRRACGRPDLAVRSMPWWFMRLAAPLVPFFRELNEMRYLWFESIRLDNHKLTALLGQEPHTPLDQAVRRTLDELGCL